MFGRQTFRFWEDVDKFVHIGKYKELTETGNPA